MTYAQTFHDGLVNLIAELKRDGRGERRIRLKSGKRKEVGALGTLYAFAWSDPADLIFEGARLAFQAGLDRQEATVVLVSPGDWRWQNRRALHRRREAMSQAFCRA